MICDNCGGTVHPVAVWTNEDRVALECPCGHLNRVVPHPPGPRATESSNVPSVASEESLGAEAGTISENESSGAESSKGRTDAEEPGRRQCEKCGHRQEQADACVRCGFVFGNYVAGEMPWEYVPEGKEEAWEGAERLWDEVDDTAVTHEAFAEHCRAHGLQDFAARKYRFRLADNPGDSFAREQLDAMLEKGRDELLSLLKTGESEEKVYGRTFRRRLLVTVFFLMVGLAFLFVKLYPNMLW